MPNIYADRVSVFIILKSIKIGGEQPLMALNIKLAKKINKVLQVIYPRSIADLVEYEDNLSVGDALGVIIEAVDTLESSATTMQTNIKTLQSNVSTLQSNVSTLQSNVTSLQTSITSLTNSVNTNTTNIAALTTRMSAAEDNIEDILSKLEDLFLDSVYMTDSNGNTVTDSSGTGAVAVASLAAAVSE